ncbi:fasciclin domain-containing protein [Deinococcus saxicola]|uniref:fasciclin domain-containing protein n=2 Tax=Deinococcus saxicola TaxID=249406 RepID=UPI003D0A24E7
MLATPALAGGAGAPVAKPAPTCMSIAQIVTSDSNFSTLATAVEAAGLTETLQGGSYTVFAPTNAAFAKLPSDTLAAVLNDPEALKNILLYHVVPGKVTAKQVMGMTSGKTAQGTSFLVTISGGKVMIDNATVTKADVVACNGIVHVIDTVLMPAPVATAEPVMEEAAPAAEMPAAETPATEMPAPAEEPVAEAAPEMPMAPAAASIADIPALPLSGATAATPAPVVEAPAVVEAPVATDTTTTTDTATTTDTVATDTAAAEMSTNSLYDVIVADDRFSTLRDLLSDAGITDILMDNEYTIFAPTNEAFAAVDPETLALIASDPNTLQQVLLYHIVTGKMTADQVSAESQIRSLEGSNLAVKKDGDTQMVGEAKVAGSVDTADNGVIYVIDKVLLPPTLKLPAPPTPAEAPVAAAPAPAAPAPAAPAPAAPAPAAPAPAAPAPAAPAPAAPAPAAPASAAPASAAPVPAPAPAPAPVPVATAPATTTVTGAETLVSRLQGEAQFSTLLSLLQTAELTTSLMASDVTLFAPTNDAFAKLPKATLDRLMADKALLKQVLSFHVVTGRVTDTMLQGNQLRSLEGSSLDLQTKAGVLSIGVLNNQDIIGATVNVTPIIVGNSAVYPISSVLIPPGLTLGSAAPAAAPAAAAPATPAPVAVLPAAPVSPTPAAVTGAMTLEQRLASESQFSTLLSLLQTAGLTTPLMASDVTLFAPTNDAFAKLPKATLDALMADKALLKQALSFHVVTGRVMEADLKGTQLRSLEGSSLDLKDTAGMLMVGVLNNGDITGATVNVTPIIVGNSAVYPINAVLIAPDLKLPAPAASAATAPAATAPAATAPVMTPPAAPVSPTPAAATGAMTLQQRLASEPQFSTLLSLLQTAELTTSLMASDVTLFAPTNDAFAKLPKATLDRLMADKALLKQVLSFHVVTGRVTDTMLQGNQLRSLEGSSLDLQTKAGVLSIGVLNNQDIIGATVNVTPIIVGNSAVYPINSVLIPPTFK